MNNEIIAEELTNRILRVLENNVPLKQESITFEIQDYGQCVMIYIQIDEFSDNEWPSVFERVGRILNEIVPGRHGDYSWVRNVHCGWKQS